MVKILVVDDELSMREFLEILLQKEGYVVESASNGNEAVELIKKKNYDIVITDIIMQPMGGVEVLRKVKEISPLTVVILITAYASTETAVDVMKAGGYDYITKPFKVEDIKQVVSNALNRKEQEKKKVLIQKKIKEEHQFGEILGKSPQMLKIFELISQVSSTKSNVFVTGESGTGKELAARAIHERSPRVSKPFVTINCGGIPDNLMESELFGHKKGSFSGALFDKMGLFETANRGTVFLDEIGDLSLPTQTKLLRVLQEKTFKRVGGTEDIVVDVRIISATNKNLEEEVMGGFFREDLYYRLNVIQIELPPLRKRREDIPLLAEYFLNKYSQEMGKEINNISDFAMKVLMEYNFPGNVRELENIIERSVALENSNIVLPESFTLSLFKKKGEDNSPEKGEDWEIPGEGLSLEKMVENLEKNLILKALKKSDNVKKRAAELLKISFRTMRYKLDKYGIKN